MTAAISVAVHDGAKAVVCASTGNTSASMAAYAAKAGLTPLVLVPEGKIAAGKMAQAILHGAKVIMVRGNFDACLELAKRAGLGLPRRPGQLGQPGPARGPEDRGVRDRRLPRRRARLPPAAGRQRRQHLGVLARLHGVLRPRHGHPQAPDARLPGRGCGAAGDRRAVPRPGDPGHRDPDRQPGLVEARRGRRARVRRPVPRGQRRPDPGRAARAGRPATASSSSRPRPPASPGCSPTSAAGDSYAGSTVVVTVTGHGLKDTATALEGFGPLVESVVDADVTAAAEAAGLRVSVARGAVRVSVPATSANLGPGFDSLGLALDLRDELEGELAGSGLVVEVTGDGAGVVPLDEYAPRGARDAPGVRRRWADSRRGSGSPAATPSRTPAAWARPRRRSSAGWCWPGRWSRAGRRARRRGAAGPRRRAGGPPRQRRPGAARRLRHLGPRRPRRESTPSARRWTPGSAPRCSCRPSRCRPRWPAGCCPSTVPHADAAADAGEAALLVAALGGRPDQLWRATRDYLHQDYRRPAMPASLDLVDRLRADGLAAVVSGAGPTVLVLVVGRRRPRGVLPRGLGAPPARRRHPRRRGRVTLRRFGTFVVRRFSARHRI